MLNPFKTTYERAKNGPIKVSKNYVCLFIAF